MKVSKTDLAWAAGILDGEGYLSCGKGDSLIVIHIDMIHRETIRKFCKITETKMYGPYKTNKGRFYWRTYVPVIQVKTFLTKLLPYLVTKRKEALILLELCDEILPRGSKFISIRTKRRRKFLIEKFNETFKKVRENVR